MSVAADPCRAPLPMAMLRNVDAVVSVYNNAPLPIAMESLGSTFWVLEAPFINILAEVEVPITILPNLSIVKRLYPVDEATVNTLLVVVPTTVSDEMGEVVPMPNDPVAVSEAFTEPAVIILRALLSVVPSTAVALNALPDWTKAFIDEVATIPDTVEVKRPVVVE